MRKTLSVRPYGAVFRSAVTRSVVNRSKRLRLESLEHRHLLAGCDPTGDGLSTADDVAVITTNFGRASGATLAMGDCTGDGKIGTADLVAIQAALEPFDFGDAPDPTYPTLDQSGGARHRIRPGYFLGASVDPDRNGLPSATANGDDTDGVDDEDGVRFLTPFLKNHTTFIEVTASDYGYVQGWVDWEANGVWESYDRAFVTYVNPGTTLLSATVPDWAAVTGANGTFARFRFNSTAILDPSGPAIDGEVEDYRIQIRQATPADFDFGDAPDEYYTTISNSAAAHHIRPGYFLGSRGDAEANGQPTANASGDDSNGGLDDEDGVTFLAPFMAGTIVPANVTASAAGYLSIFVDWDRNGTWEPITTDRPLNAGLNATQLDVPLNAVPGASFARFRFSSHPVYEPFHEAPDGEVEDYAITLLRPPMDYGDAASQYYTTVSNYGAAHVIVPGVHLGATIDAEADGFPSAAANGDDTHGIDDEDGVIFSEPFRVDGVTSVDVIASTAGYLSVWVDLTQDGTHDLVLQGEPLVVGHNTVLLTIPSSATPTVPGFQASIRFRFGTSTVYSSYDPVADGEVEDYLIDILPGVDTDTDFGDAPNLPSYYTTLSFSAAYHHIRPGVYLGAGVDGESNGQPSVNADGDDTHLVGNEGFDDEDGVRFLTTLRAGQKAVIEVTASAAGYLNVFADWYENASWQYVYFNDTTWDQPLVAGVNRLEFTVPSGAPITAIGSQTYMRFRFSTVGNLAPYHEAVDGEVEDYAIHVEPPLHDFGDAPYQYYTTLDYYAAYHDYRPGWYLGSEIDFENDGQPTAAANGDDIVNYDDEDGVRFLSPIQPFRDATIEVTASTAGWLTAFQDFNNDGGWESVQFGGQNSVLLQAGVNTLTFPVPQSATAGDRYMRFRFSSQGNLSSYYSAPDGEIEDYRVHVENQPLDYGDAPFAYYTTNDYYAAWHWIVPGYQLGARNDLETDGQPSAGANGDDLNGVDDEDGVRFITPIVPYRDATIEVTASGAGFLNFFFDFDQNNSWERVFVNGDYNIPVMAGVNMITFPVPQSAVAGPAYARFRFSSAGGLLDYYSAPNGEVEDYQVTIETRPIDFGDAPFDLYTTLENFGAGHWIRPGVQLGVSVDREPNGQPSPAANADDLAGLDDEDGVLFLTPLRVGQNATVQVTASVAGYLTVWADLDGNLTWESQLTLNGSTNPQVNAGINSLTFQVPAHATPTGVGQFRFVRFRYTTDAGILSSYGIVTTDGEVEDYAVAITASPSPAADAVVQVNVVTRPQTSAAPKLAAQRVAVGERNRHTAIDEAVSQLSGDERPRLIASAARIRAVRSATIPGVERPLFSDHL